MHRGIKALAPVLVSLLMVPHAMAIGLKLPGQSQSDGGGGDAMAMQDGLVTKYQEASGLVMTAQKELAMAFEMKGLAATLDAEILALQSGATLDKDAVEKTSQTTEEADKAIQEKIDQGEPMSEKGREHYVNSLLPFAQGMKVTSELPGEASKFSDAAQAQISSASMMEKASVTSKLGVGTYLAKEIPGFSSRTMDTFKKIVTYAQSNDIPVPEDATALLGM